MAANVNVVVESNKGITTGINYGSITYNALGSLVL